MIRTLTALSGFADQRAPRILVVEDDAILALDLGGQLEAAGFEIVGPAGNVDRAVGLIESIGCDAAVLDIHLGRNVTSEPIAERLIARAIPFLTVSGYGYSQRPLLFTNAPLLSKPIRASALIAMLNELLDGNSSGTWARQGVIL